MRSEIAMKLAAAEVGVSEEVARAFLQKYQTELGRCPVCNGKGSVLASSATVRLLNKRTQDQRTAPDGDEFPCPSCTDLAMPIDRETTCIDLQNAVWNCVVNDQREGSSRCSPSETNHADCDYRIVMPISVVNASSA